MQPAKRNNFFNGKLLVADEFSTEQQYHQEKQHLQQPGQTTTSSSGVVSGLAVSEPSAESLHISSGIAVDAYGRECLPATEKSDEPIRAARKEQLRKS